MDPKVREISKCFIKPKITLQQHKDPLYLTPWDLAMLSVHYIQKGLLFVKPNQFDTLEWIDKLKRSLALTLVHFYPLAGRLVTAKSENPASYVVYVDCYKSDGAGFIHAAVDLTISDVLGPDYVPLVVQSFFDHDRAVNHDGHTRPLLTIQATELIDGLFVGCSMNHSIGDGASFWNFFNTYSEVFRSLSTEGDDAGIRISRPPVIKRWFPEGYGPIINLPYKHHDEFVGPYEAPELKERIFHFTADSLAKLKAKAHAEAESNGEISISTFQSLSALIWRCITRARNLSPDTVTSCRLAGNNRPRLNPPLSPNYFGNSIEPMRGFTTAGELLIHNLGWAALLLNQVVAGQTNEKIRKWLAAWMQNPAIYRLGQLFDPVSVMMGSSPRFDKYGCEFGLGKAVALRSGYAHKFSGKVSGYPGNEGGGSIDLEVCLPPDTMTALEADHEFMEFVSVDKIL